MNGESWFECIVPGDNMFVLVPSANGRGVWVKYPFFYGNVVCVQE